VRPATAAPGPPRLPEAPQGHGETVWWGMVFLVVIETVVFASLILSYFYLWAGAPAWPPAGVGPPDLGVPVASGLLLFGSVIPVALADRAAREGRTRRVVGAKIVAQALLTGFIVLKVVEYAGYDYDWASHAYGSIVWTMAGLHVAHGVTVLLKSVVIVVLAARGYFTAQRFLGVQANAFYWYFVAAIGLPIYATLYLAPRLL
jgi:cytochrome c oxidase subunit 3